MEALAGEDKTKLHWERTLHWIIVAHQREYPNKKMTKKKGEQMGETEVDFYNTHQKYVFNSFPWLTKIIALSVL